MENYIDMVLLVKLNFMGYLNKVLIQITSTDIASCHDVLYSGTPLVRPPLLNQKSGLLRGVAPHQG